MKRLFVAGLAAAFSVAVGARAQDTRTVTEPKIPPSCTLGPGPVNLKMAGESSTVNGTAGKGTPASCADKFVPFPSAAK